MADKQSRSPFHRALATPKGFGWDVLMKLDGDDLEQAFPHEEGDKASGDFRAAGEKRCVNPSAENA